MTPLGGFLLRTFLWLPLCFGAWYLGSPVFSALAANVSRLYLYAMAPGLVSAIEPAGRILEFVTTLEMPTGSARSGVLVAEVDPLTYTYGLPLYAALMLAARAPIWKIALGAALLLPFQGWGLAFDFLVNVGVKMGPEMALRAGLGGWRTEFIALGYQLGALVFPGLAAVVIWAAFNREFLASSRLGRA